MKLTITIEAEDAALAGVGPRLQALIDAVEAEGGVAAILAAVAQRFGGGGPPTMAGDPDMVNAATRVPCPGCGAAAGTACTLGASDLMHASRVVAATVPPEAG